MISINGIGVRTMELQTILDLFQQINGQVDIKATAPSSDQKAIYLPSQATSAQQPTSPLPFNLQVFSNPGFVTTYPTTLIVKEKISWNGDDFSIKDTQGQVWFCVAGRAFSLREKKVLHDSQGQPIWIMKDQYAFGPNPQDLFLPHNKNQPIATIQPKWTMWKAKMTVRVPNQIEGGTTLISLKGDPMNHACSITLPEKGNIEIAKIQRVFNATDIFFNQQTYHVSIVPGIDAAIIVALCISFDELANEG